MSQAPMMPVWPDALLGDTLHLSAEQFGAYLLLLFATWRNNGKPLPDDDRKLARICRSTLRHWRRALRPTLIEFFEIDDGTLHQKRLESEWNWVNQKRESNSRIGARGGAATALKYNKRTPSERSSERSSERQSERQSERPSETAAPIPLRCNQEEVFIYKNLNLGCAYAREGARGTEPPSAEDKAAVDAVVGAALDTLALPATGLRNGVYAEAAYRQAIIANKRDRWLNALATWAGEALPGLPEKMAAWEAIEETRAAGSRKATPPAIRQAVDQLSRLRKTSAAYAEAAE